jgi:hypothetical protein
MIEAALAQTKGKVSGSSGAAAKLGIPGIYFGIEDQQIPV